MPKPKYKMTDDQRFELRQRRSLARWAKQNNVADPPPIIGIPDKVRPRHVLQDSFMRLYQQAKSLRDLAHMLGDMNVQSVRNLCLKFGLPTKIHRPSGLTPSREITQQQLLQAYKKSFSIPQLAQQLNCNNNVARNLCRRYYLPTDLKSIAAYNIRVS